MQKEIIKTTFDRMTYILNMLYKAECIVHTVYTIVTHTHTHTHCHKEAQTTNNLVRVILTAEEKNVYFAANSNERSQAAHQRAFTHYSSFD